MAVGGRAFGLNAKAIETRRSADSTKAGRSSATIVASFLGLSRSINDNVPRRREPGPALELDCLRGVVAPTVLRAAKRRSQQTGTGADQVLIRWDVIGVAKCGSRSPAIQRYRLSSAADSSGLRLRSKGRTNFPLRSIR
jgi:hypothetical protein